VVDVRQDAVELTSEPQDLADLLVAMRSAYQGSLLDAVQARKQLDADVKEASASAERDSRLFQPDPIVLSRLIQAWRQHGADDSRMVLPLPPADLGEAERTWLGCLQRCIAELRSYEDERTAWEERHFKRRTSEPRLSASFHADVLSLQQVADSYEALREAFARRIVDEAVPRLRSAFSAEASARDKRLAQLLGSKLASIQMGVELLGPCGQAWDARLSGPPALAVTPQALARLGVISSGLPQPYAVDVPCVISFPLMRGLAITAPMQARDQALELLRSVVLRILMNVPPGQLHLALIDPTAMGQTFAEFTHLGDYDERLIDTGVKTSAQAIDRCLAEQAAHLETVISKYLRGQFQNIHDYNRQADEMTEPYRLIVVADYPRQFSDRAAEQLLALAENGPRCGVYTLLLYSSDGEEPRGVPFARLTQSMDVVSFQGGSAQVRLGSGETGLEFIPDRCPPIAFDADGRPSSAAAAFIESLGLAAKRGTETVVTLDNFLPVVNRNRAGALPEFTAAAPPLTLAPISWWTATTTGMAVAPIGRSGAQGVVSVFFSSTTVAGGAIMVGLPRSGKTTSLHAMILMMAMLYSPEELELYLIDAKHGVEFKAYERLPHARMVSVRSEREFSLAVLRSIRAKIRERAELIKAHGSGLSNITEYRTATGEKLPRIVVIIDEFHELFEEADTIGSEAFAAFSDIVRIGPFSGVHMVVASQTLSAMPAMDRQTLTLLPQRVAFMCNDYDAEILMGDSNKAPRMLTKTGEGLFNPARGDESRNQLFQGLHVTPEQRGALLRALREKADAQGWTRQPRVFDGDAVVIRPRLQGALKPGSRFTVPVGEPFTLADSESLVLPRSRGANVLLVGDRDDEPVPDYGLRGVIHSFLAAAQAQHAAVTVVDFIGDEDIRGGGLSVMEAAEATGARYVRSARLDQVLLEFAAVMGARSDAGDYKAPTQLLVLFGLQRALSLTPYDPYSSGDSEETELCRLLVAIAAGGPEVGVHTVIDADRARSVEVRLGSEILAELTLRVAGSGADRADLGLVSGAYGEVPALRFGQLLIGDTLKGSTTRARAYQILMTIPDTPEKEAGDV
jgi:DNA segregation ATPase FtsK/SpoIIIE, S-DNA-T family